MEQIIGRAVHALPDDGLRLLRACYAQTFLDFGTGDGRLVRQIAIERGEWLAIGVDAARVPLERVSRRAPANALFLIANATALPSALEGLAAAVSVVFPYGSLLGMVCGEGCGMEAIAATMQPGATIDLVLNAGAFADHGVGFEPGVELAIGALWRSGLSLARLVDLDAAALRRSPTTWGRRLAFGRDPRAKYIRARKGRPKLLADAVMPLTPWPGRWTGGA